MKKSKRKWARTKAKLYTNLLLPICLAINSFCELVGEILYLYALNIVQIYNYFKQKTNIVKKIYYLYKM